MTDIVLCSSPESNMTDIINIYFRCAQCFQPFPEGIFYEVCNYVLPAGYDKGAIISVPLSVNGISWVRSQKLVSFIFTFFRRDKKLNHFC